MVTLYKGDKIAVADFEQVELMAKAGWKTEKHEAKKVTDKK